MLHNPYASSNSETDVSENTTASWVGTTLRALVAALCGLTVIVFACVAIGMAWQAARLALDAFHMPTRVPLSENLIARAALASWTTGGFFLLGCMMNLAALLLVRRRRTAWALAWFAISIVTVLIAGQMFRLIAMAGTRVLTSG